MMRHEDSTLSLNQTKGQNLQMKEIDDLQRIVYLNHQLLIRKKGRLKEKLSKKLMEYRL